MTFKVLIVGNSNVGKSSIMLRMTDGTFSEQLCPTVGLDFKLKQFTIGSKILKLSLWDTAGQERFRALSPAYYRGAHAIVFVFDVSNCQSFNQLEGWIQEADRFSTISNVVKMVIGNKIDKDRAISREEGVSFARSKRMLYLETSAKDNKGIAIAFTELVEKILECHSNEIRDRSTLQAGSDIVSGKCSCL